MPLPALSIVGDSGVGKTTLLCGVVRELVAGGLRVAAIKHSKEFDDPDPAAKDSARLRRAGASRVVLASPARTAVFEDHPDREPGLEERLALAGAADLVLVESWSAAGLPALEVLRAALPRRVPRLRDDPRCIALVADFEPDDRPATVPLLPLSDHREVARFLRAWLPARR